MSNRLGSAQGFESVSGNNLSRSNLVFVSQVARPVTFREPDLEKSEDCEGFR